MRLALLVLALLCLVPGIAPWLLDMVLTPAVSALAQLTSAAAILELPDGSLRVPSPLLLIFADTGIWPAFVALPVFGALAPAFFPHNERLAGLASLLVLLLTAGLVVAQGEYLDALSWGFALLVPLVGALNVVYALGYMSHSHSQWRFLLRLHGHVRRPGGHGGRADPVQLLPLLGDHERLDALSGAGPRRRRALPARGLQVLLLQRLRRGLHLRGGLLPGRQSGHERPAHRDRGRHLHPAVA